MPRVNSEYAMKVKYVDNKLHDKSNNPYTRFSIGEKIKDDPSKGYINFSVTVWNEHLDLQDGDSVILKTIDEISCYRKKSGKYAGDLGYNLVGTVEIIKENEDRFAQGEEPKFYAPAETDAPVAVADAYIVPSVGENFFTAGDESTPPFDL